MRINRVEAADFKSLESAAIELAPLTVLTGQNGTGKTSFLEAIQLLSEPITAGQVVSGHRDQVRVGTAGTSATMRFSLTATEFEDVDRHIRAHTGRPASAEEFYTRTAAIDAAGNVRFTGSPVAQVLFDPAFRTTCRPPSIKSVPVLRVRPSTAARGLFPQDHADPAGALSAALTALDYRCLVDSRRTPGAPDDYAGLTERFRLATGKHLSRPNLVDGTTQFQVEIPGGQHGLDGLSSGELGLLHLFCELYEGASVGGVLLLDEPEIHLHPSLQAAFLSSLHDLSDRVQVVMVTHSPVIVSGAQNAVVYEIRRSAPQAQRAVAPADLFAGIGLTAAHLMTTSGLLVVEGVDDDEYLKRLFPDETGRLTIQRAAGRSQVLQRYRMLDEGGHPQPWMCLIDRDLMTKEEMDQLAAKYPRLHIWPRRAIESMLFDATLLAAFLARLGRKITVQEAEGLLVSAVGPLLGDAVTQGVTADLTARFPIKRPTGRRLHELQRHYYDSAEVMRRRGDGLAESKRRVAAEVRRRWPQERFALADPKKAMKRLADSIGLSNEHLINGMLHLAHEDLAVRPKAFEDFRVRLADLIRAPGI